MNWLDIVLLVWLLVALVMGTRAGFVYAAGRLLGLILGIWLAGRWTPNLASAFGTNTVVTVVIFLVLLSLLTKIGGLLAWIADKFFKILTIIPFLKTFNKVFGGVLGLLISIVIIGMGVLGVQMFASETPLGALANESRVATGVAKWSSLYDFLLPGQWTGEEPVIIEEVEEKNEELKEPEEVDDEKADEEDIEKDDAEKDENEEEKTLEEEFEEEDIELLEI